MPYRSAPRPSPRERPPAEKRRHVEVRIGEAAHTLDPAPRVRGHLPRLAQNPLEALHQECSKNPSATSTESQTEQFIAQESCVATG
jgi:hypothetical protein